MILTTTETVPGKRIGKVLGLVRGSTIRARHVGKDILAVLKNVARKYGWQYSMIGLRNRIKSLLGREVPPDCGVVITPRDADERGD